MLYILLTSMRHFPLLKSREGETTAQNSLPLHPHKGVNDHTKTSKPPRQFSSVTNDVSLSFTNPLHRRSRRYPVIICPYQKVPLPFSPYIHGDQVVDISYFLGVPLQSRALPDSNILNAPLKRKMDQGQGLELVSCIPVAMCGGSWGFSLEVN